jgi:hypothetical protein
MLAGILLGFALDPSVKNGSVEGQVDETIRLLWFGTGIGFAFGIMIENGVFATNDSESINHN